MRAHARQRIALFITLATVVALLGLPAPAAAEVVYTPSIQAGPATITRGGQTYRVTLDATATSVTMLIERHRDPDGSGPKHSRMMGYWSFWDLRNQFTAKARLGSATLKTGNQLAPFGVIDATFAATKDLRTSCNGHVRARRGVLKGTIRVDTGTDKFGVVRLGRMPAVLRADDGRCNQRYYEPCGTGYGVGVEGPRHDGFTLSWSTDPGGKAATIMAGGRSRTLKMSRPWARGFRGVETLVSVPVSHTSMDERMDRAVARGAAGTVASGRAVFRGRGEVGRWSYECGRPSQNRETVTRYRMGRLSGTMTVKFLVGPSGDLATGPFPDAQAHRSRVRQAN